MTETKGSHKNAPRRFTVDAVAEASVGYFVGVDRAEDGTPIRVHVVSGCIVMPLRLAPGTTLPNLEHGARVEYVSHPSEELLVTEVRVLPSCSSSRAGDR